MDKIPVGILGATGTVGQKFITLLQGHPYFEISELVASERSAGHRYGEIVKWKQDVPVPVSVASLPVKTLDDSLRAKILFSGLDSTVAGEAETNYARLGHVVISNSKNHRMDVDVPLVIPEINPDHLELVLAQPGDGAIVTNSNCSTMFLAMALAPLHRAFGVSAVHVTTMQAISGAGYPGVPSMDILGNVIPYIGDEEEKMESETQKILGTLKNGRIEPAPFAVSAQCNRVAVFDGHTETLSVKFERKPAVEEVARVLRSFAGLPQERRLPSAPAHPIIVMDRPDHPQPARHIWLERGMATCVGRIRACPVFDVKMVLLGHNTVRGAAGAAILNGETFVELGYLKS